MRAKTGTKLSGDAQSPDSYTDRTLSPYNLFAINEDDNPKTIDIGSFVGGSTSQTASSTQSVVDPATVTSISETLEPGIPVYVNQMDVATGNAFMTIFITLLLFLVFFALLVCIVVAILYAFKKYREAEWAKRSLADIRPVLLSNGLRLVLFISFTSA